MSGVLTGNQKARVIQQKSRIPRVHGTAEFVFCAEEVGARRRIRSERNLALGWHPLTRLVTTALAPLGFE